MCVVRANEEDYFCFVLFMGGHGQCGDGLGAGADDGLGDGCASQFCFSDG